MKDRAEIRWGILGCGDVAEVKSGPAFQRAERSRLVAVMRRNEALAEDYARRHGVPRFYSRSEALISDPGVDAVYIASPPGTHLSLALAVCRAGKPAYVEKPMARSGAECRRMVEAFRAKGLPLFVAYYRRALPRFVKAKELIESGSLGEVRGVFCRYAEPLRPLTGGALPWRLRAEESGGGLLLDLGSHTLDILDFLVGPLEEPCGDASNAGSAYEVEDTVAMHFRTRCGALGTASWSFAAADSDDRIEIALSKGRLTLATFANETLRIETSGASQVLELPNPPHVQQGLIQSVVDELGGTGRCPSDGVSAARTSVVMDRVLLSYYGSRSDDFWNRQETWPGRARAPKAT